MDVAGWLRDLGLDQYEAAFRANGVDAEVLPALTGEELKDIGVSLIRHRRRLLEAIAALRSNAMPAEAPVRVSPSPAPADPSEPGDISETTAELCTWPDHVHGDAVVRLVFSSLQQWQLKRLAGRLAHLLILILIVA